MNRPSPNIVRLHVYSDENDWFVAESLDEALTMWREMMGTNETPDDFEQVPDDKSIPLNLEDARGVGTVVKQQSAAEWAKENGKGYLASRDI